MKIYHGTDCRDILSFDFNHCGDNKDFGKGVYFTTKIEQAIDWSLKLSSTGAVYECDVDFSGLKIQSFSSKDNEDQMYVLYLCRIGLEEIVPDAVDDFDKADVIYGYVLDGSVRDFMQIAEQFNQGDISFDELCEKAKIFGDEKDQICVKTSRALELVNHSICCEYHTNKAGNGDISIVKRVLKR